MVNLKKVDLRKTGDIRVARPKVNLVKNSGRKVNLRKER